LFYYFLSGFEEKRSFARRPLYIYYGQFAVKTSCCQFGNTHLQFIDFGSAWLLRQRHRVVSLVIHIFSLLTLGLLGY